MERTARFQPGDQVVYVGSIWRRHGFMDVNTVKIRDGQPVYTLTDPVWGGTLRNVREASLRDDDLPTD
jgi:hypothetical protein